MLGGPDTQADTTGALSYLDLLNQLEILPQCYITYAVKCCAYKDPITLSGGPRVHQPDEIQYCSTLLFQELVTFNKSIPIITLGNVALSAFIPNHQGITRELGSVKQLTIHNKIFNLLPNYHPESIVKRPHLFSNFKKVFTQALNGQFRHPVTQDKVKLLGYEESLEYLNRLLSQYKKEEIDYTVFDIESTSLTPFKGKSIMYSFATDTDTVAYSIPLIVNNEFRKDNTLQAFKVTGTDEEKEQRFQEIVQKYTLPYEMTPTQASHIDLLVKEVVETIPIVGHNLKFDLMFKMVESHYDLYKVRIKWDTYISAHQLYGPGEKGSLTLKNQAKTLFQVNDEWDEIVNDKTGYLSKYRFIQDRHYGNIPTGILGEYSALDAFWNKYVYKEHLQKFHPEQLDILQEVTRATIPFAEAEGKGIYIDPQMYLFIKNSFDSVLEECLTGMRNVPQVQDFIKLNSAPLIEKNNSPRKRVKMTDEEILQKAFSPNSHPQVRRIIHQIFGLPILENFKTEGGKTGNPEPQTGADALTAILNQFTQEGSAERTFIHNLLKFKEISTLKSRLDHIPSGVTDDLYKTDFLLATTKTGRLSSPFHSIPSKSSFKYIFGSRWKDRGGLFLAADQSQLEVRIGASIANETTLIDAYKTGVDVHSQTAADIFKVPLEEVTSKQRGIAKAINFGILYGKTAKSLAIDLNVSKDEAQKFIDLWYSTKPSIKQWIPEQIKRVFKEGYVMTPMGRVIYVPEVFTKEPGLRKHAENCSINFPVQSSASDIGIRAGNEIAYKIKSDGMKSLFLASVHDSLEYDVYPGELFYMIRLIKEESEDRVRERYSWIKCPLKMDVSLGSSWGGALELSIKELTPHSLTASTEGLRKDFFLLEKSAKNAYNIKINVISKSPPKPFAIDCVVRDNEMWKADIEMSMK